ncbi:MAG: hypothetical protein A2847_01555 [Candidatus Sungbacteria bacterium RIFCSPHIGHO2_01_FULL_50_25]|uniref:Uncharacterized protein n=1 Tax=Candidatus Sungbacteria bacterium RIFCSPHIGHO2_01_FULL_50_25 TaxID=1802265 RepID=A0A1G2KDS6_9BACT|nr:MAG: hypothetical protein A2847_01555 [Candidatus Sungbacteria bacterium RIFCSPHIGHO2_01_FULL_50_25]
MALYFLELSQTYCKETDQVSFRRRQIVAKHLKDNYKSYKNRDEEILARIQEELAGEGIAVSASDFRYDKLILRTAYAWLRASDEDRTEARKKVPTAIAGQLEKDGILTWARVRELAGLSGPKSESESRRAQQEPSVLRTAFADFHAGEELASLIGNLVPQIEGVLEENRALKEEVFRHSDERGTYVRKVQDADDYIELLEGEILRLEEQLREARASLRHARSTTLEEIAREHPEIPHLTVIAQQLKNGGTKSVSDLEKLRESLPTEYAWPNDQGRFSYSDRFLRELAGFEPHEQERVARQLGVLGSQGSGYASLHTRKIEMRLPFSPPECFVSRGADDLRFTWSKKEGEILVHWVYRKGDSRVRQSEA